MRASTPTKPRAHGSEVGGERQTSLHAFRARGFTLVELAIVLFILLEPRGLAEVWRIIRSGFRLWPFSY